MCSDLAGVLREFFKFRYLKLNTKWSVLHFKSSCDLLIWNKRMNYATKPMDVSFRISCFKLITAMFFTFEFYHFCSHPLLNNFRIRKSFKNQFQREIKLSCDHQFLSTFFG